MTTIKNFRTDKSTKLDKDFIEREMQILTLANSEVKRRGYDESHDEFGEMVEDLVYRIHRALYDSEKFLKVINKWREN